MIARISPFNPKYPLCSAVLSCCHSFLGDLTVSIYTGGPGTCISLGIGSLLVDNDAEGHFLTPCAMYSDCVYFRVCLLPSISLLQYTSDSPISVLDFSTI